MDGLGPDLVQAYNIIMVVKSENYSVTQRMRDKKFTVSFIPKQQPVPKRGLAVASIQRFKYQTPRFRYAAKVSQSRYGICRRAAAGFTFRKVRIIHNTNAHNNRSQTKANPKA